MKKIYAILVALSALSIVLAGCSKGDDTKDAGTKDAGTKDAGTKDAGK